MEDVLAVLQQNAGFMKGMPPLQLWKKAQKAKFENFSTEFVPYFEKATKTDRSSTEFLILCLRLLELPTLILKHELPKQKGVSEKKLDLSTKSKKVETLTTQNRLHAASKVCSPMALLNLLWSYSIDFRSCILKLKSPIADYITPNDQ